jgi:N-acetylglucosamine-6-sulfatase
MNTHIASARRSERRFARSVSAILALALLPGGPVPASPAAASTTTPNIVLILTDDQRFDTLWAMPTVESELVGHGVDFVNGFVSNPLCCPSRSSILTGEYSHTTGVYSNRSHQRYGGFAHFDDRSTVATWLNAAGYRTGLFGKYLNGYSGTYEPPGWDRWFATYHGKGYYNYTVNSDGGLTTYGSDPADYSTTVLTQQATDFIRSTDPTQPLFLYFAPHGPHAAAIPAPGDGNAFADLAPWRPPSYDKVEPTKPEYVRHRRSFSPSLIRSIDSFRLDQYRTLLSLDRAVARILGALDDTSRLSDTMIVFMSDNGMLWGEHGWHKKVVPYEESIRVPFVVRYDPLVRSPRVDPHLVVNVDLAPTFAALAGVSAPNAEGMSMVPLLSSPDTPWRSSFLIEHMRKNTGGVPTYCGVQTRRYEYVDYVTGEEELYDLRRDPYQLHNRADAAGYHDVRRQLRNQLGRLCRPTPPGFSLSF